MNNRIDPVANLLNSPIVMLLRLTLMVPLIGIWLFDPIGIQSWTTAFGTSRENGLLTFSLLGEFGAILAAFAAFAQPRRPLSVAVNIAILITCTVSYFWGCLTGLWMGMEPGTAVLLTIIILALAVTVWLGVRRYAIRH